MLKEILTEFENANTSLSLGELSRRLGVEKSALEAMVDHLVRMGRLQDDASTGTLAAAATCRRGCSSCGHQGCPSTMRLPRTYSLPASRAGSKE